MERKNITLVIMAAGIGSRFGGGVKQLTKVGPGGQVIIDYSIRDAIEAGFNKIVFVIRHDIEADFKEIIGNKTAEKIKVEYCYQEKEDLPAGFTLPEGRTKPWGTGHAILAVKNVVKEPFAVINADDYYGKKAFRIIYDYLAAHYGKDGDYCMAGFILKNTLSDNGGVTRGVVTVDGEKKLVKVDETKNIVKTATGAGVETENGVKYIDENSYVSMNMWGLQPSFLPELEKGFTEFLSALNNPQKDEYLLPIYIDEMIHANKATVTLLETQDSWFGVTYAEDKESVMKAFEELTERGEYPTSF